MSASVWNFVDCGMFSLYELEGRRSRVSCIIRGLKGLYFIAPSISDSYLWSVVIVIMIW